MSPLIRAQYEELLPYQRQVFQELIMWGNSGGDGLRPSDIAYEKAIAWAKQVPEPPAPPPSEEDEEEELE